MSEGVSVAFGLNEPTDLHRQSRSYAKTFADDFSALEVIASVKIIQKYGVSSCITIQVVLFQTSNELDQKILKERYIKVDSVKGGLDKALTEDYAFVWGTDSVNSVIGHLCTHVAVKKPFSDEVVAFPAKKQWPYLKLMNHL